MNKNNQTVNDSEESSSKAIFGFDYAKEVHTVDPKSLYGFAFYIVEPGVEKKNKKWSCYVGSFVHLHGIFEGVVHGVEETNDNCMVYHVFYRLKGKIFEENRNFAEDYTPVEMVCHVAISEDMTDEIHTSFLHIDGKFKRHKSQMRDLTSSMFTDDEEIFISPLKFGEDM